MAEIPYVELFTEFFYSETSGKASSLWSGPESKTNGRFIYRTITRRKSNGMEAFTATLEACDPARALFRSYQLTAGIDLLGDWLIKVTYGRIGARGRCIRYVATDEQVAGV